MAGEDFVMVQLSAKGEELAAGSGSVEVLGNHEFSFPVGGKPQRVTRAVDWELLSQFAADGVALFELAPPRNSNQAAPPSGQSDSTQKEGE